MGFLQGELPRPSLADDSASGKGPLKAAKTLPPGPSLGAPATVQGKAMAPSTLTARLRRVVATALCLALVGPLARPQSAPGGGFLQALTSAARALEAGRLEEAREWIERALERDPRAVEAWSLRARWAEAKQDPDDLVYSLHQALRNARAQKL